MKPRRTWRGLSALKRVVVGVTAAWLAVGSGLVVAAIDDFEIRSPDNGMFQLDGDSDEDEYIQPYPPYTDLNDPVPSTHDDFDEVYGDILQNLYGGNPAAMETGGGGFLAPGGPRADADVIVFRYDEEDETSPSYHETNDKDIQELAAWGCQAHPSGGKDDLKQVFISVYPDTHYVDPPGVEQTHLVLYGGAVRDGNEGVTYLGLWLFQTDVTCDTADGSPTYGKFMWSEGMPESEYNGVTNRWAQHLDGDVLLLSNFVKGGRTDEVFAFRWTDPCDAFNSAGTCPGGTPGTDHDGNEILEPLEDAISPTETLAYGDCADMPGTYSGQMCGMVNQGDIYPEWAPDTKNPPMPGVLDKGKYFEGGVDLTNLTGIGIDICVSSFLMHTRSSAETTASLSDQVAGRLDTCGAIIVRKYTDPTGHTAEFGFLIEGGPSAINVPFSLSDQQARLVGNLFPGTYSATEESWPTGWNLDDTVCGLDIDGDGYFDDTGTPGVPDWPVSDNENIPIAIGQRVVCEFFNNLPPKLKLVKTVTNDDGGMQVADDWTLYADAPSPDDGRNFSNLGASGVFETVFPGVGYLLSESTVPGYAMGNWSCTGGGSLAGSTITLSNGDEVTCTMNNDDIAPTLKLVKTVTNDDGGDAVADDWTLYAAAASPDDGRNFSNPGGSGVFETVFANAGYALSESTMAGYTAGSWSCDGGTLVGSTLTLTEGETGVTCTIDNDDIAPTLKLVKTVTNDDGGDAVADDWTLYAAATSPDDGRNFSNPGGSGVFETVFAGVGYVLSESTATGYIAGNWSCDGGTLNGSTLTLAEGETGVTCTITNDDIAPTLTLIKTVINDGGGTLGVSDFPLFISGSPATSGVAVTLSAGDYVASETEQYGYAASAWGGDCDAAGNVTLGVGDDKTCTITNDDIAPTLTVIKYLVPMDDSGLFDLIIYDGSTPVASIADQGHMGQLGPVDLYVGTFIVGESAGTATSLGDYDAALGGDCAADGSVSLALDEDKVCTITNTRRIQIDIVKTFNGLVDELEDAAFAIYQGPDGFGGTPLAADSTLGATGGYLDFGGIMLPASGTYTLCEEGLPVGWTSADWYIDDGDTPGIIDAADTAMTPYNPHAPTEDLGYRCVDFGAGPGTVEPFLEILPGETLSLLIDNRAPEGDARTPGYWSNWSSCSNGNQFAKATQEYLDGVDMRHYTIDEILPQTIGILNLNGDGDGNPYNGSNTADCEDAVAILQSRDIEETKGKKPLNRANDAAYKLARSLLAYLANQVAGAYDCQAAADAADDGQALLERIGFDGSGAYLDSKTVKQQGTELDQSDALMYHGILDGYNNNMCM